MNFANYSDRFDETVNAPEPPTKEAEQATAFTRRDELGTVTLSDVKSRAVEWLWMPRVAIGKLTLFAGDPGLGKSQISIDIAARITQGVDWPDGGQAPLGNVVILSAEDGTEDTLKPRFEAAGGNSERALAVTAINSKEGGRRTFSLQADLALLGAKVQEFGNVNLVIVDPVTSYCGKIDGNSTTDIRAVLAPLNDFAEHHRVAIIAVSHPPKSAAGGKALYAVTGSLAWIAAARTAFTIVEDVDDQGRRLFLNSKNNLAPMAGGIGYRLVQRIVTGGVATSCVAWDSAPVTVTADQALAATGGGSEGRAAGTEAAEFLRSLLEDGPASAKGGEEHARALGIAPRTLARARKKLGVIAEKTGLKEGWNWRLPAEGCQTPPKAATPIEWHSSDNLAAFGLDAATLGDSDGAPDMEASESNGADETGRRAGRHPPCAQCNRDDGEQEPRPEGDRLVWLHPQCRRFYVPRRAAQ